MKTIYVLILGILLGLSAAALILLIAGKPRGNPVTLVPQATPEEIVIYISGAVHQPGVYHLEPGSRVEDAVKAGGGLSEDADPVRANLALVLFDGDQVIIPILGANPSDDLALPSGSVDINTATVEELDALPGIGLAKAQAIITYRNAHGAFNAIEDLLLVPGIGPSLLEQIRAYLKPIQ